MIPGPSHQHFPGADIQRGRVWRGSKNLNFHPLPAHPKTPIRLMRRFMSFKWGHFKVYSCPCLLILQLNPPNVPTPDTCRWGGAYHINIVWGDVSIAGICILKRIKEYDRLTQAQYGQIQTVQGGACPQPLCTHIKYSLPAHCLFPDIPFPWLLPKLYQEATCNSTRHSFYAGDSIRSTSYPSRQQSTLSWAWRHKRSVDYWIFWHHTNCSQYTFHAHCLGKILHPILSTAGIRVRHGICL